MKSFSKPTVTKPKRRAMGSPVRDEATILKKRLRTVPTKAVAIATNAVSIPVERLGSVAKQVKAALTASRHKIRHKPNGEPAADDTEETTDDMGESETSMPEVCRQPLELENLIATFVSSIQEQQDDADSGSDPSPALSVIRETLGKYFQSSFNSLLLFQCESKQGIHSSHLDRVLFCSSSKVTDLLDSAKYLVEETTDASSMGVLRSVLAIAHQSLEQYLEPHIFFHLISTELGNATSPLEAAKVISWVDCYFGMIEIGGGVFHRSKEWEKRVGELVAMYLDRGVRPAMKDNLESCSKLERGDEDVFLTRDCTLRTGYGSDIAFLYNMQIKTAAQFIPARYMGDVVAVCNKELLDSIGERMMQVGITWKNMSLERLCAMINDASIVSDDCEHRNASYLVQDIHIAAGENLCREFMELALFATKQLCERILLDPHDTTPMLMLIGDGASWADQNTVSAVQRTNTILGSHFDDLEGWIPRYFFAKVLKGCFDLSVERYIESFFCNSLLGTSVTADMAANAMRRDYCDFVSFWIDGACTKFPGVLDGLLPKDTLIQRLHLLHCFSSIMTPSLEAVDVLNEIDTIFDELGSSGAPAILHLVGLKKRHTAREALAWHEVLSQITGNGSRLYTKSPSFRLPDLRNSKFLPNVQPPREGSMQRLLMNRGKEKSNEQIDISSTAVLVKRPSLLQKQGVRHL